jgi:hypothetical protein
MSNVQPETLHTVLKKNHNVAYNPAVFVVNKNASTSQTFNVTTSNYSSSQTSFLVNINSRDAITSGYFLLEQDIELDVVCSRPATSSALYIENNAGFKSWPLNRMINTITLQLGGGVTVSSQVGDLIPALERCFTKAELRNQEYGLSINMPDKYRYLNDASNASNNPLATYNVAGLAETNTRGSHPVVITNSTVSGFRVSTKLIEPLWISPLVQSLLDKGQSGLTHLTSINVIIQWKNDANNMYNFFNPTLTGTEYTATMNLRFPNPPTLYVEQKVDNLLIPPAICNYAYNEISNRYTTDFNLANPPTFAGTSFATVASNVIQLDRIPKYVMVWATRNQNNLRPYETGMLAIDNLSFNFNNVQYCSEMAPPVIYANSVKNGLNMPYLDWNGRAGFQGRVGQTCGGPAIFAFGDQLPLPSQWAPSVSCKTNISCTARFAQKGGSFYSNEPTAYTMYMAFLSQSQISLFGSNSGSLSVAPLSEIDVLKAQSDSPEIGHSDHGEMLGGSGLGWLSDYITSGKLKRHIQTAREYAPLASFAANRVKKSLKGSKSATARHLADALHAMGAGEGEDYGEGEGEGRTGGRRSGGELLGGQMMSKAHLRKRLLG